jgi:membrane-associated HD superfamily phosphohydrolase
MHEPATAITDLLLAIECGVVALVAAGIQTRNHPLRGSTVLLFWALAVAALLGFVAHAFVPNQTTGLFAVLWRILLLSLAVAGSATWSAAGLLWPRLGVQRAAVQLAGISLIVFAALIVLNVRHWAEGYGIALFSYAPAMLFLLTSFAGAARWNQRSRSIVGIIGVLLSFAAAVVQQSPWSIGPLDHNALYHVIQAVGLVLIFVGLRSGMTNAVLQTTHSG